jgi:hypothetical protein
MRNGKKWLLWAPALPKNTKMSKKWNLRGVRHCSQVITPLWTSYHRSHDWSRDKLSYPARTSANADAPLDLGADLEQLNQDLDMLHVGLTIGFIFYFNLSRSLCSSAPFSLGRSRWPQILAFSTSLTSATTSTFAAIYQGFTILKMERSPCALFGVVTYGVHMSIYKEIVQENGQKQLRIWVPTCSFTKPTRVSFIAI